MSTRSGKRIHGSIHEEIAKPDIDLVVKSERKTRSRRLKENCDEVILPKSKKRHNYVSYPTDDEQIDNTIKIQTNGQDVTKSSKVTLKEQDLNVSVKTVDEIDSGKVVRLTRRTKKISENVPDEIPAVEIENVKSKKKNKKNKKKKSATEVDINENEGVVVVPKKSKRKRGKASDTVTEVPLEVITTSENLNKSNGSVDSFHSAAGSPINDIVNTEVEKPNRSLGKSPRRASKRFKADSFEDNDGESQTQDDTFDKNSKKIKLSNHEDKIEINISLLKSSDDSIKNKDDTFDKPDEHAEVLNATFEKESKRKRKSSVKNSTFDKNDEVMKEFNSTVENINTSNKLDKTFEGENKGRRKSLRSTYDKTETPPKGREGVEELNSTYEKTNTSNEVNKTFEGDKSRRKSLRSTFDKTETPKEAKKLNSTFEKNNTPSKATSAVGENKVRRKSLWSTFDKIDTPSKKPSELNSTFEKAQTPTKLNNTLEGMNGRKMSLRLSMSADKQAEKVSLNSTFENRKGSVNGVLNNSENSKLNSTFDKSKDSRKSTMNTTFEKSKDSAQSTLNTTFEKSKDSGQSTLNSTFDKETKHNSTYEKDEKQSESDAKSSLISSDSASNLTFDKSDEISRISITSDDSRTENIVNTTPLLIESSMDESQILEPSPKDVSRSSDDTKLKTSTTPLKREGTFTKESPDIVSKTNTSLNKTPVKRMSLPSPGSTPFPFSKSSQKEKSMLNVTRSIEKSVRRSSLVEAAPRQTRVMFCSPVNNPAVVMQQKRKVIKSNLKGSNKSFIFDESVKLPEPSTPSKKPITPLKKNFTPSHAKSEAKVSRTKLPNFAALHQKQFSKMESLDECQVRKAKRARQLLTPTGLAIVEKSSPKGRVTEVPKKTDSDTPSKAKKSLTLDALRPGYTRFGFKMNLDVNPFSIPPKTDAKPKESKPNGLVTRQPSQPSLAGATSGRREVAKQIVMRERSFTSLSDKRQEKRTTIKGVRTNRRFELQMKLRNINA
ncbi:hypothetical protein ABMA28_007469 [Loxostege sticticalis]|uniref:Uncharacterized protein n=1 Tax=Loxostege sticticalis TaxID=481309 RepID=A0ABD0SHL3_LOXSC